jgi:hypothetical protein
MEHESVIWIWRVTDSDDTTFCVHVLGDFIRLINDFDSPI